MVSAPTGCGKTVVLEMAIIRLLIEEQRGGGGAAGKMVYSKFNHSQPHYKIITF